MLRRVIETRKLNNNDPGSKKKISARIKRRAENALMRGKACTIRQIGQGMINCVLKGYPEHVLEVKDLKKVSEM